MTMYCVASLKPSVAPATGADTEKTSWMGFWVMLVGLPGTGPGSTMASGGLARISPLVPLLDPPVFCCSRLPALLMEEVATDAVGAVACKPEQGQR